MIKYYCKPGQRGIGMYNTDTDDFDVLSYMSTNIDWAYVMPEDGEISYRDTNDKSVTKSVKKYDIVLQLYRRQSQKHNLLIIRSKEWKENLKAEEAYNRKRFEEDSCEECGECNTCCSDCIKAAV